MTRTVPLLCLLLTVGASAGAQTATAAKTLSWEEEVAAWKQTRFERLQKRDGWLTLVGLGWLKPGDNAIGSDPQSAVVLPAGKAPARLGTLRLAGSGKASQVTFVAAPGAAVMHEGAAVSTLALVSDADAAADAGPTQLTHGTLSFFAIRRGDRIGIRVKDSAAAALQAFHGLDYYPLDRQWKIEGRFEAAAEAREIPIPNALGFDEPILSPGHVVFTHDGREHRLLALDDTGDGRLFLVFGDRTNGRETYGGGRFLYTDPPQGGKVVLDFNRSYNPPCVFTPYATCPLPPRENRLPLRIEAGEKRFAGHDAHP
jgi:uncharacterized protein (DUF1684 family)